MSALNGVLPVDKPVGPTSHDVVDRARRALRIRRIGHTGTLDPFASGLLLLCLGPATRLAEYLTAVPKSYSATLLLGVATTTDDAQGEPVRTSDAWRRLDRDAVRAALRRQQGDILQVPPAYSAKRVGGERMYDVARRGGTVELDAAPVHVARIELTRFEPPEVDFEVDCSSGTYIRAIARDVGDDLQVGGHLSRLRRTRVGRFQADAALTLEQLEDRDELARRLLAPAAAVAHLPSLILGEGEIDDIRTGRAITRDLPGIEGSVALLTPDGGLAAIGLTEGGKIRPRKVFLS